MNQINKNNKKRVLKIKSINIKKQLKTNNLKLAN